MCSFDDQVLQGSASWDRLGFAKLIELEIEVLARDMRNKAAIERHRIPFIYFRICFVIVSFCDCDFHVKEELLP